jgi:hypothetical protein
MLRKNGEAASATVRGLSDEQLQRSGAVIGNSMSTEQAVQNILIGHVKEHTASIRQAR